MTKTDNPGIDTLREFIGKCGTTTRKFMEDAGQAEHSVRVAQGIFDNAVEKMRSKHPEVDYDPSRREHLALASGVRAGYLLALLAMKGIVDKTLGVEPNTEEW